VTAKGRSKVMKKAPVGAFCITFELHEAVTCLHVKQGFFSDWPLKVGLTVFSMV